jgi:broad specificity phosphatase PhoE
LLTVDMEGRMMENALPEVYLARHGETAWSLSGQHTGRTDIPLPPWGERHALRLGERLRGTTFAQVLTSQLSRARRTCELAGFGDRAQVDSDQQEWDYGEYEGRRTADIRQERPGWYLFRDGCPGGESVGAIGARADRMVSRLRAIDGRVLIFSHGHFLRVLTVRWLGLPAGDARYFVLSTATLSVLGYEHHRNEPAIRLWNDDRHVVYDDIEAAVGVFDTAAAGVRCASRARPLERFPLN